MLDFIEGKLIVFIQMKSLTKSGSCDVTVSKNYPRVPITELPNNLKWSYDPRSYERNFCKCVEKSEKFRTAMGFEPMTSRYRCDALINWAMKPLTLGASHNVQHVHNCEDHSFTWFYIRSSIYDPFHISFHRYLHRKQLLPLGSKFGTV